MASDDAGKLPETVAEHLCGDPDVEFVVVFGSRETGATHASSDLDVAVKFSADCSKTERFRKRCRFSGTVQDPELPFIDISDIENLPLPVAHEAVTGTFVCGSENAFEAFKTNIQHEFEDQRAIIKDEQREVIRRIAEDGLHN